MEKYLFKKIDGEEVAFLNPEWAREVSKKRFNFFLKLSCIPKNYWGITFDDCSRLIVVSKDSLEKAKQYSTRHAEEKFLDINLFLTGSNLSGKSSVACCIGKEFIRSGLRVQFVLAGDLTDYFLKRQGFNVNVDIEQKLKLLYQANLVIIDDAFDSKKALWWNTGKDLIISEWDRFLRTLMSNHIRIVITSNIAKENVTYGTSIQEALDGNFISLTFEDKIKEDRKKRFENLFS